MSDPELEAERSLRPRIPQGAGEDTATPAPLAPDAEEGEGLVRPSRFRIRLLEETPSTNEEVKRALDEGEAEGLVVRARRQLAGYGRQGRTWASPEGGLYCSLLLRPKVEPAVLPTLSLMTGIAVRRAIVALVGDPAAEAVRIKWPNDVVVVRDRGDGSERLASDCVAPRRMVDEHVAQNDRCARFCQPMQKCDQGFYESEAQFDPKNRAQRSFCASKGASESAGEGAGVRADEGASGGAGVRADKGAVGGAAERADEGAVGGVSRGAAGDAIEGASEGAAERASEGVGDAAPSAAAAIHAKLCGISLEAHRGGVCVGVGVNVLPPDKRPDVGGKNRPAYVADFAAEHDQAPSVEAVLDAFLEAFAPLYEEWMRGGFAPFVSEFNAYASLTGHKVGVVDRMGAVLAEGAVERVDEGGRLIVRDATGFEVPVSSGEAHLV